MPVAVGFWVIFLYYGIYINIKNSLKFPSNKQLLELALILISTLLMLSLSKHKEVRFLLGIYPLFPIYASIGFYSLIEYKWKKISLISIILIFISNYIMVIDHAVFTHFGVIDMMDYIRNLNINNNDKILFLTKCHDFPYYAHIHKFINLLYYFFLFQLIEMFPLLCLIVIPMCQTLRNIYFIQIVKILLENM